MVSNVGTLLRRIPSDFKFSPLQLKPIFIFRNSIINPAISCCGNGSKVDFSCHLSSNFVKYSHGSGVGFFGFSKRNLSYLNQTGFGYNRFRAVSNSDFNGSGGFGGSGSGSGNPGGRNEDEGGQNGHSLISWYMVVLEKYPVLTKALTSALLTFIGDLICQLLIDSVSVLDLKRTVLFTLLGFVLVGPTLHFWYLYLSKLVSWPGGAGAFLRLLLDQFLFSPLFIGFFLVCLLTLEGRPSEAVPKLRQEWFSTVLANWQLWIPFQFLNFLYVPQRFQVLAANFIALAWNVILSFKAHKGLVS